MSPTRTKAELAAFLDLDASKVTAEATKLASKPGALAAVYSLLFSAVAELRGDNEALRNSVEELQKQNTALETRLSALEPLVAVVETPDPSLEDRLLKSESYSGRSTTILTGIPEDPQEDPQEDINELVAHYLIPFSCPSPVLVICIPSPIP